MKKFKKPDPRRSKPGGGRPSGPHGHAAKRAQTSELPKGRAVVGIHAVKELLKVRPRSVTHFWVKEGFDKNGELNELVEFAQSQRVKTQTQSGNALDKIASVNQGVIAFSDETPELSLNHLQDLPQATLLVLDEVEDPHNLGAVLRTGWLFGIDGVLTPETRAVGLNATVSKVAQGAVEHIAVMQESGLLETLKYLKEHGYWLYGLSHKGTKSIYKTDIPEKVIWVLGSESSGIRRPIEKECDELIQIPQVDPEASLNVSVAAAIAIGETYRQRHK